MNKQVLFVIDDEADLCELLAEIFRDEGYEVFDFTDPITAFFEAQKRIENHLPLDLVLTDVNMFGLSGIQLAKDLRAIGFANPVILLSGECGEDIEYLKSHLEVTGVEQKPYQTDKLLSHISEYLKKQP